MMMDSSLLESPVDTINSELQNSTIFWDSLRKWFLQNQRSFPWRQNRDPYAVWVSEVMLQQTRAEVVIPYFERWMKSFPSIAELAEAPWEKVLKAWEGLGYYSRAKRLQEGAQLVVRKFGGELPFTTEDLQTIPGLGPYTVAAIQAFSFHMRSAPVDGNVLRVRSRLIGNDDPIDQAKTQKQARAWLLERLPVERPFEIAEALIELGACVCKPKAPRCEVCPMRSECVAYAQKKVEFLPIKAPRKPIEKVTHHTLILWSPEGLLVEQVEEKRAFGLLHRFPTFTSQESLYAFWKRLMKENQITDPPRTYKTLKGSNFKTLGNDHSRALMVKSEDESPMNLKDVMIGSEPACLPHLQCKHTFVHTQCTLIPWMAALGKIVLPTNALCMGEKVTHKWIPFDAIETFSFPSGHRSLLQLVVAHGPYSSNPDQFHSPIDTSTSENIYRR